MPGLTTLAARNLTCKHNFTLPRILGRAGLVAAADRTLPGPLHELGMGVPLELHHHGVGNAGAVVRLRGRRQHLAVRVPGPLFCCIVPGRAPACQKHFGRLLRLPDSAGAAGDAILVAYDSTRGSYAAVTDVLCACANTGA